MNLSTLNYITFNRPNTVGNEFFYMKQAITKRKLSGNGFFTNLCQTWLEKNLLCKKALLTPSCTSALELAAILIDIKPGDEVIMPSFTFVSTANAFVLRGGVPVFVDIRLDTLNIDEQKIEEAITNKTKAIVPVHYSGVGCEMDTIMEMAHRFNLYVIEDAAQSIMSYYKNRPLGSIGHLATFSFHETKNVTCGEGGALILNNPKWVERAEIIREKGTNRSKFFRGEVNKYTWIDIGSSFLLSEINAAFLWAQLEKIDYIHESRMKIWEYYHRGFEQLEKRGLVRRPIIPEKCRHNAHIYYLLVNDKETRDKLIKELKKSGIEAVFHYIPLHCSLAGKKYGRAVGDLSNTNFVSDRLIRLPIWVGMSEKQVNYVISQIYKILETENLFLSSKLVDFS